MLSSNGGASDLDADDDGMVVAAVVCVVVTVLLEDVFGNTGSCGGVVVLGGDGDVVVWVIVVLVMSVSFDFDLDGVVEMAVLLVEGLVNADLWSVEGRRENRLPG